MKIGFTGTRNGMTDAQGRAFDSLLRGRFASALEFHHGDCVGADAEAGGRAYQGGMRVVIHPPVDESHRAHCRAFHEIRQPQTHLARNRNIVNETDVLIACPMQAEHQTRGGTWYTIDYANKKSKPVYVITPAGQVIPQSTFGGEAP